MLCTSVSDCRKKGLKKLTFSNRILQLISLQFDTWRIALSRCFSLGRKNLTVEREQDSCFVRLLFSFILFSLSQKLKSKNHFAPNSGDILERFLIEINRAMTLLYIPPHSSGYSCSLSNLQNASVTNKVHNLLGHSHQ